MTDVEIHKVFVDQLVASGIPLELAEDVLKPRTGKEMCEYVVATVAPKKKDGTPYTAEELWAADPSGGLGHVHESYMAVRIAEWESEQKGKESK